MYPTENINDFFFYFLSTQQRVELKGNNTVDFYFSGNIWFIIVDHIDEGDSVLFLVHRIF